MAGSAYRCSTRLVVAFLQIDNVTTNFSTISKETQILTANVSILTPENITSATKVVGQIFNASRKASAEVKLTRCFKKGGEERKTVIPGFIPYSRIGTWAWFMLLQTILQSTLSVRLSKN